MKNLRRNEFEITFLGIGVKVASIIVGFFIKAIFDYFCAKDLVLNLSRATVLISSESIVDAISFANQLGRLDLVSLLLAFLGIILGLGAIAGFMHIKETSQGIAERETRKWLSTNGDVVKSIFCDWIKDNKEDFENMIKSIVRDKLEEMSLVKDVSEEMNKKKKRGGKNISNNDLNNDRDLANELFKKPKKEDE